MSEEGQGRYIQERDPELEDVLREIERLLEGGGGLGGPSRDTHLTVVEAIAAPFANAFVLEIHRLDEVVRKGPCGR